jgi:hypothetical protein
VFTVMVIMLLVAVVELRQVPPVTVITQVIASALIRVLLAKVLLAPFCTLVPFFRKS